MSSDVMNGIKANETYVPGDLGVKESGDGREATADHAGPDDSPTVSAGAKYAAPSVSSAAARAAQCSF